MPRRAEEYARLLLKRLRDSHARTYLINTGWKSGGVDNPNSERYTIATTRSIVEAIQNNTLSDAGFVHIEELNLDVPKIIPGVDSSCLQPRTSWQDDEAYSHQLEKLQRMFEQQQKQFIVDEEIENAGFLANVASCI